MDEDSTSTLAAGELHPSTTTSLCSCDGSDGSDGSDGNSGNSGNSGAEKCDGKSITKKEQLLDIAKAAIACECGGEERC